MDILDFIDAATISEVTPERIHEEIWETVETRSMPEVRSTALAHTETQAEADRLVQEILIEDDIDAPRHLLEHLPLISPEKDLGKIGETRMVVEETEDKLLLEKEEFTMIGLYEDGRVATQWETVDDMVFTRDEFSGLKRIVLGHPV